MPAVVGTWTGRESALLRSALRLSMRAFAEHLGVATRTVAKWEAKGAAIRPLPDMQAILDTALNRASAQVRERFDAALAISLEQAVPGPATSGSGTTGGPFGDRLDGWPDDLWGGRPGLGTTGGPSSPSSASFASSLGAQLAAGGTGSSASLDAGELDHRLSWAGSALDADLVALFEQQTQAYRLLDRRLGAGQLLARTEAHVRQMSEVLTYALAGPHRCALAAAVAEGAALAGWQALDLGLPDRSWVLHETAKAAAAQSGDPAVFAHVSAQQAYALLDVDRPEDALSQIRHARELAGSRVPAILRAWLSAAEAEATAATGREREARAALDRAVRLLAEDDGEKVSYLALDPVHLTRWRGHCLARLGADEAVAELSLALDRLDPTFVRAAAGLHCDLAIAHTARSEWNAAGAHAEQAERLADETTSVRQQRRIRQLVAAGKSARQTVAV